MASGSARGVVSESVAHALEGKRIRPLDIVFRGILAFTLVLAIGVLLILLVDVGVTAAPVLLERPVGFLTSANSSIPSNAGVEQGIVGSLQMIVIVLIVSVPIGIGAAIYLEEYAPDTRFTRLLSTNIRNLAGVPSIVYGLLGLAFFVEFLGGLTGGTSVISGGLTLAVLVLPIVIITSAEAIRAVPQSIRDAAYGLGAARWQVVRGQVLPAAGPGILTGMILTLARALGETAALLLVGALLGFFSVGSGSLVEHLRGPYTSLPTIIFGWSTLPNREFRQLAAAAIVVLLVVLLLLNAGAVLTRNRYEKRW